MSNRGTRRCEAMRDMVTRGRQMVSVKATAALLAVSASFAVMAEPIAIVNVNVIPMTSAVVKSAQTVIVADGMIRTVGAVEATPVPEGATVVDGTDRYLMPGLTEMHAHIPDENSPDLDRVLSLFVANGVTTVRGMLGQASHLDLRERIATGAAQGPRLITAGPSFNGRSVDSPADAAAMVRRQAAAGYDFLKIHPGLTIAEFDAIAATANEVGLPFAGHVPEDVGVEHALRAGIATIDHLDGYMETLVRPHDDPSGGLSGFFGVFIAAQADESKLPGIVQATVAAGVWNVPTQSLFIHVASPLLTADEMAAWPEMQYMPAETVASWRRYKAEILADVSYAPATALKAIEIRRRLIRELHEAGAGLLLGSDSPQVFNVPGFALHRELGYLVDAGLSPYAALEAGTSSPARFFAQGDRFGTVQEGMQADLLMLDANPLDNVTNSRRIHGVMLHGHWLSREVLDELLQRFAR